MKTNLRKLLVEESVPLPIEVEIEEGRITQTIPSIVYTSKPGQTVLAISEDGESIVAVTMARRFLPPLVRYSHPTPEMTEGAIQQRIQALFDAAAGAELPLVEPSQVERFFREALDMGRDEPLRLLVSSEVFEGLELGPNTEAFEGHHPTQIIGIKGRPGAVVTTPVGVGIFIGQVSATKGARIQ